MLLEELTLPAEPEEFELPPELLDIGPNLILSPTKFEFELDDGELCSDFLLRPLFKLLSLSSDKLRGSVDDLLAAASAAGGSFTFVFSFLLSDDGEEDVGPEPSFISVVLWFTLVTVSLDLPSMVREEFFSSLTSLIDEEAADGGAVVAGGPAVDEAD